MIFKYLTFEKEEADIIWLGVEFKLFPLLKPNQHVNQFPDEHSLVFKHRLFRSLEVQHGKVDFLPTTHDMEDQLAEFIGDFQQREVNGEDNHWIVKPWNWGRSQDMGKDIFLFYAPTSISDQQQSKLFVKTK